MKKTRIILSGVLLFCVLCLMLAACGAPEQSTPSSQNEQTDTASADASASDPAGTTEIGAELKVFDFDVSEYVEIPDISSFTLKKQDVDDEAGGYLTDLIENNPVSLEKTEGTIEENDVASIYYKGVLIPFEGELDLDIGATGIPALDQALPQSIDAGQTWTGDILLPEDFALPAFIKRENDLLAKELAGNTVNIAITAPSGAQKGELSRVILRFGYVFAGGTYDENSNGGKGYDLVIGSGSFIPGFEDGMIGMSVLPGSVRTIPMAFPSPYRNNPALAGENCEFTVTIVSVTGQHFCDLDDPADFALFKENYLKVNEGEPFDYASKAELTAAYVERAKAMLSYALINDSVKERKLHSELFEQYKTTVRAQIVTRYGSAYYNYIGRMLTEEEIVSFFFGGSAEKFTEQVNTTARTFLNRHLTYFGIARTVGVKEADNARVDEFLESETAKYRAQGVEITPEELLERVYSTREEVVKEILINDLIDHLAKTVTVVG